MNRMHNDCAAQYVDTRTMDTARDAAGNEAGEPRTLAEWELLLVGGGEDVVCW